MSWFCIPIDNRFTGKEREDKQARQDDEGGRCCISDFCLVHPSPGSIESLHSHILPVFLEELGAACGNPKFTMESYLGLQEWEFPGDEHQ
jgi:hypothetical protein